MNNKYFESKCLWRIRLDALKNTLSIAERKIGNFLENNSQKVVNMTITEVAEAAQVSDATVVRFCKNLGYKGFQDLKISIAESSVPMIEKMYDGINENDSSDEIINKVFTSTMQGMQETFRILNGKELTKAIELIAEAKHIDIYGLGGSAVIANDLKYKLLKIGIKSDVWSDNHLQAIASSQLTDNDVVIAISYSGSSRDICESVEVAKEAGAKIISITHYAKSPLYYLSDVLLFVTGSETMFRSEGIASQASQIAIIDSLYVGVGLRLGDKALESLEEGRKATVCKGY